MEPSSRKRRTRNGKSLPEGARRARRAQDAFALLVVRLRGTRVGVIARAGAMRAANDPVA